ncbi:MAG: carbohydrate ABC transporter substrate-binding protein, partial [Gemmatimonadota bacterium]|nr:carbohydrate ABC transporter substrate-binding protein [Gemmatimonadota bacterium]
MNSRAFRRSAVAVAAFSASAIVLAGCAGGGETPAADSDEPITLTIATFNDFGYTDELLQEYMDENPNITVEHTRAAESGDARSNYFAKLGKGGLADIEG